MLFGAEYPAVEHLLPAAGGRRGVGTAVGRQGGKSHGGGTAQPQLQIAAVEQGVQAGHGDRQHRNRRRHAGLQRPVRRVEFRSPTLRQQITGHPAAGAGGDDLRRLAHQRRQGQERCGGLAGTGGLRQRCAALQQFQGHGVTLQWGDHHRQPERRVEGVVVAGVDVMAEQIEATVQRHRHRVGAPLRKGRQQDAFVPDQLGIVVVHHQHRVQCPWKRADVLLASEGIGLCCWTGGPCGDRGGREGDQGSGQQGSQAHGEGWAEAAGGGLGTGLRWGAMAPAMARIRLVDRGSLNGPFTRKPATARRPSGSSISPASA